MRKRRNLLTILDCFSADIITKFNEIRDSLDEINKIYSNDADSAIQEQLKTSINMIPEMVSKKRLNNGLTETHETWHCFRLLMLKVKMAKLYLIFILMR